MFKKTLVTLSLVALVVSARAQDSKNVLHFPQAAFSIAPLESPPGEIPQSTLMMFLEPSDSFAPNVNVMIQPFPDSMHDYVASTLDQFKKMGWSVVKQTNVSKTLVFFEYKGKMQGQQLHWYARAEKVGDHVYLVTATSKESQWVELSQKLRACVDSFHADNAKQP